MSFSQEQTRRRQNLLFICSRNQWHGPTAEKVWSQHPDVNTRSAGTSPHARKTVNARDIQWCDVILVMEKKHKNRIVAEFSGMLEHKPIHVLDIPDDYGYMDDELVGLVTETVASVLNIAPN